MNKLMTAALEAMVQQGNNVYQLPYSVDFSTLADGPMPSRFSGVSWTVASGKAINVPALGSELFDPGAGTFDSGTYGWIPAGGNTIANDVNCLKITYVNNAGGASNRLESGGDIASNMQVGKTYKLTCEVKTNVANSTYIYLNSFYIDQPIIMITETDWTTKTFYFSAFHPDQTWLTIGGMATGDIVWIRNMSLKNASNPIATLPIAQSDVVVRSNWTIAPGQFGGIILNADKPADQFPTNSIRLYAYRYSVGSLIYLELIKVVNGVPTSVVKTGNVSYAAGRPIEVRKSGSTLSLYYNGTQVGSNQTISDATIIDNRYHGLFSGGGASCDAFFLCRSTCE